VHTPTRVEPGKALQTPEHSPRWLSAHLHRTSSPSTSATRWCTCGSLKWSSWMLLQIK